MDPGKTGGSMERWRRRFMRLMLPLGMLWLAYGVLLGIEILSSDARSLAVFQAIFAIAGGIIFVANWWVYRREQKVRRRGEPPR